LGRPIVSSTTEPIFPTAALSGVFRVAMCGSIRSRRGSTLIVSLSYSHDRQAPMARRNQISRTTCQWPSRDNSRVVPTRLTGAK
jgi:hypothetical protein